MNTIPLEARIGCEFGCYAVDLTKEQRDQHIRRYAELMEEAEKEVSTQIAAKPKSGPQGGRPKGIASKLADETGLSKDTIRRALNPQPKQLYQPKAPQSDEHVRQQQVNALMSAWNRASSEARAVPFGRLVPFVSDLAD